MIRKIVVAGLTLAALIGLAVNADSAVSLLRRATFRALGAGAVDRTAESKLRDVVSVKDYGAVGDGTTDDTTAIQAALNYITTKGGATIYFPLGTYKYSSPLTISSTSGIRLVGDAWDFQQSGGSTLLYTGTASPAFSQTVAASNPSFEGLNFAYNNAGFTGTLVSLNGSDSAVFRRVAFIGRGVSTATYLLSLNNNSGAQLRESQFDFAQYAILGQATDGTGNANAGKIQGCRFGGGIAIAHIRNVGQGWDIAGSDFEGGPGATFTGSIVTDAAVVTGTAPPAALSLHGNWFGDFIPGGAVTWVQYGGNGFAATGNFFNCANTGTAIQFVTGASGVEIGGNQFRSCATAVALGTITDNVQISGNNYTSVTNNFTGTPQGRAILQNSGGFALDLWGNGTRQMTVNNSTGAVILNGNINAATGTFGNGVKLTGGPLQPTNDAQASQTGSVYQGSGVPSNSNGNNGDVYFRTDTPGTVNQRVYVKSAGSWVGIL